MLYVQDGSLTYSPRDHLLVDEYQDLNACDLALVGLGFIEIAAKGKRKFGHIFVVHPDDVVQRLRTGKKVPDWWWSLFDTRPC